MENIQAIKRIVDTQLPTEYGDFTIYAYGSSHNDKQPQVVLVNNATDFSAPVALRIHSECLTGDLFGSTKCDCGQQLQASLRYIAENGGLIIYLRQEGRGIGLINKLEAYRLQSTGLDTIEANVHLGFEPDERDYSMVIEILKDLNITSIDLITNNPDKIAAIEHSPIKLNKRIALPTLVKNENENYLSVKKNQMGHLLDLSTGS